ncbi:MAG TPA: C1 family peptidase [Planctomycetaceae bacterium]|jgi:hypothetical protein|nr:C1 family peptidase [Planctomycetaceae bacterium]
MTRLLAQFRRFRRSSWTGTLHHRRTALLLALFFVLSGPPRVVQAATPMRVDLRPSQSPIRDQKGRRTCIVHSVCAAMEAELRRSGQDVDLSEDTFMYFVKQFWLSPIEGQPADTCENQVGGWEGGNGVENLAFLTGGLAIPEEAAGRPAAYDYKVPFPWGENHWKSQFNVDSWNLSPRRLLPSTLRAPRYFTLTGYRELPNGKDPRAIEQALAQGHEVVWDFKVNGKRPRSAVWHYDGPGKRTAGQHSMLIVGYDRSDRTNPYFIVKNSHGPTKTPGANGFTYIGYDYLQYGHTAGYLTGVKQVSFPELQFVGRWEVNFAGWKGILDISHIPGVFRGVYERKRDRRIDRRIGTFYDHNNPAEALRVNGSMKGNRIDFYVDWSNPNPGLDKLRGRHFTYYLSEDDAGRMSGTHRDPDGRVYRGFARRLESDAAFPLDARRIDAARLPEMASLAPSR